MGSNVSHFRGCFGSWFIRYLALRRISGSARQTTVSSVPVVSASRTVAKPRLYISFFSCHNSILQLVIGVGPTDQWSITACHVHRRPEAERKMINWDHIALRGNQKGDGPKSLVASELLRADVVVIDPCFAQHFVQTFHHGGRAGNVVDGRRCALQMPAEHLLIDQTGFTAPS